MCPTPKWSPRFPGLGLSSPVARRVEVGHGPCLNYNVFPKVSPLGTPVNPTLLFIDRGFFLRPGARPLPCTGAK
jgi:hypothetical protein